MKKSLHEELWELIPDDPDLVHAITVLVANAIRNEGGWRDYDPSSVVEGLRAYVKYDDGYWLMAEAKVSLDSDCKPVEPKTFWWDVLTENRELADAYADKTPVQWYAAPYHQASLSNGITPPHDQAFLVSISRNSIKFAGKVYRSEDQVKTACDAAFDRGRRDAQSEATDEFQKQLIEAVKRINLGEMRADKAVELYRQGGTDVPF